jgi:EmrB/QacA subfamily drug resistance transporter
MSVTRDAPDPRRWVVLAAVAVSALVVTIDNGVLTVAIPTVMHEFDTTLPSVQWVITGYSLVFATLLIIGGRLGDLFGHRRTFVIGALLFALGSLLATVSWSVPSLFVGEALVEGIGASLMLPATLAVISTTFQGRERATAFAVWGGVVGVGAALGPVLGGFFTSELSWRWAFGINILVAPISALGVVLFLRATERPTQRPRLDVSGAALISSGLFLLVFGISEGGTYGWWSPLKSLSIGGAEVWPASLPVSLMPIVFGGAAVLLTLFVMVERRKERALRDPLFEFGQLRHRGFRYGLVTNSVLAMSQLAILFVLAVFLQEARHLTPMQTGLWLFPLGAGIAVGARAGAALTHRIGPTSTVRWGLGLQLVGLLVTALFVSPSITFGELCLGITAFGGGIGIASSQLTNVILSDVDEERSGVASGSNTTVRQVGGALGVAIIGTILTVQTVHHTTAYIRASDLPAAVQVRSIAGVHAYGPSYSPPRGTPPRQAATLERALVDGVSDATQPALLFATAMSLIGIGLSFLIPRIGPQPRPSGDGRTMEMLESLELMEPIEPGRDAVLGPGAHPTT